VPRGGKEERGGERKKKERGRRRKMRQRGKEEGVFSPPHKRIITNKHGTKHSFWHVFLVSL